MHLNKVTVNEYTITITRILEGHVFDYIVNPWRKKIITFYS